MPRHVAIIMDGNRRWASARGLPKAVGHGAGSRRVRAIVQACGERGISHLTLFAFSTENWRRPLDEVSSLLGLLALYLQKEIGNLNAQGVRLRVIGDTSGFDQRVQALIRDAQASTDHNRSITLTLALNYGGRWDMLQAVKAWQLAHPGQSAEISVDGVAIGYMGALHPTVIDALGLSGPVYVFELQQSALLQGSLPGELRVPAPRLPGFLGDR